MFSGIVQSVGRVLAPARANGGPLAVGFEAGTLAEPQLGASIAVNGVCLTVTAAEPGTFTADVSRATLDVTTLGGLREGARVNLEPALRVGDALDGHWVMGHVDGAGRVIRVTPAGGSRIVRFAVPDPLARYVATKGAVAVDGVSLTVNAVAGREFEVNLVPHTRAVTIADDYAPGTAVNVEVDIIARYLERLLASGSPSTSGSPSIGAEKWKRHGYASED